MRADEGMNSFNSNLDFFCSFTEGGAEGDIETNLAGVDFSSIFDGLKDDEGGGGIKTRFGLGVKKMSGEEELFLVDFGGKKPMELL